MLARGEQALPLRTAPQPHADTANDETPAPRATKRPGREIVLYAHLSADALHTSDPDAVAEVTNHGFGLVTAAQIATWCGLPDTTKVTVKPVIDLNTELTAPGYRPSERLDEQVKLRDRECVFQIGRAHV